MVASRGAGSDATRVTAAVVAGAVVGFAAGYPALPDPTAVLPASVGGDFGTTGLALIAGALAILVVPLGTFALYQALALSEE